MNSLSWKKIDAGMAVFQPVPGQMDRFKRPETKNNFEQNIKSKKNFAKSNLFRHIFI